MLRNELLFRKLICKHDYQENPDLYKVNCMSEKEMKVNFAILLSGDHEQDADEEVLFPDDYSIFLSCSLDNNDNNTVSHQDETPDEETGDIPLSEP